MQRKKICNTHLENMRMKDTKVSLRSRDSSWLKWSPVWYQPWVDAFLMYFSVISATPHRKSFSNNKSFEFPKDHSIWLHLMTQLAATFLKRSSFSFMSDIVLCQIQFECKWIVMFINAVSYTWQQTHFYLTSSMVQVENKLFKEYP